MGDLDKLQYEIGKWAEATFPDHTDDQIIKHLRREVQELDEKRTSEEVADCMILLLALANRNDWPVFDSIVAKHVVNKHRQWGPPDAEGIREHV